MDSHNEEMALSPVQPFSGRRVQRISRLANKKNQFINPKMKIKLGNWNVRTLNQEGKLEQLTSVFDRYSLDMCALTETRLTGFEKRELDEGKILLHSGREDGSHYQGVGLLLNKQAGQALDEWEPVNERIMYARLKSSHGNMSIMVCYAPTNEADDNRKDNFYAILQEAIDKVPKHDILLCIGDMNAKLGNDNEGFNESMGVHGMGEMNENGLRFASFCMANELVIGSTIFEHRDIHKYTWISPCGRHRNQIDHIAINMKYKTSLLDVKSRRGADIGSDHQLVVSTLKLKLKRKRGDSNLPPKYDIEKLRQHCTEKEDFIFECRNRFTVLQTLADTDNGEIENNVNTHWREIEDTLQESANTTLGQGRRVRRKKWLSDETWDLIQKRKTAKLRFESSRNDNPNLTLLRAEHLSLDSEVKRCSRRDKRRYINQIADRAEEDFKRGGGRSTRYAYEGIREITGAKKRKSELPVRDINGNMLTKDTEIRARWKEHFETILNRPIPPDEEEIPEAEQDLPIDMSIIRQEEVYLAIKQLKNYKSPGMDGIAPEMLKADEIQMPAMITELSRHIWRDEVTPDEWKNTGIIIKIPKKGDLRDCGNWRGITLSPVVMKVFSRIILNRIEPVIDRMLRIEQAGFRRSRGCNDQIFILRHITQQCNELKSPLVLCFIDFEKAFDSISRGMLKKILRYYGIPIKIVNLIMDMHHETFCRVMVDGNLTDPFEVKSGVLQGGILSPLLFILVIDYVMRRVLEGANYGIQWKMNQRLSDLDYADDIVIIAPTVDAVQEMLDKLVLEGGKVGLVINRRKTEIMQTQNGDPVDCYIEGEALPISNSFKYLGTIITDNGSLESEFKERIKKAEQAMGMLRTVWQSSRLSIHTKIELYISLVRSVLLYGHQSWYSTSTTDAKFLAFENKALRRILGIRWHQHITNAAVREVTNVPSVIECVRLSRWRWMGHILRRGGELVLDVPDWKPEGRRGRGRPRETWLRTMQKEVGYDNWHDLGEMAQDRDIWREFIGALCIPWVPED